MKVSLIAKPMARFTLTEQQVRLLMLQSEQHYDATCRAASKRDSTGRAGFILSWQLWTDPTTLQALPVTATFRELDTALKCMEYPDLRLSLEEQTVLRQLFSSFWQICKAMGTQAEEWKHEFETEVR